MQYTFPKYTIKTALAVFLCFCFTPVLRAQTEGKWGQVAGNFQFDGALYYEDTLIGAPEFPEKVGANGFLYMTYSLGNFRAGGRFEMYAPALQGFTRARGAGISHRFAQYTTDHIDVTVGTFYEQFGSGMTLRSYESWGLGFDNAIDGARVKIKPVSGLEVTGLIGNQRNAFSYDLQNKSEGIVRGANVDMTLNDLIPGMDSLKTRIKLGYSFVSRFQADQDPQYVLPKNVGINGFRMNLNHGGFGLAAEYVTKVNDPSTVNNQIYKPGSGLLVQGSYSRKGLGISVAAKRIDNLDFRSDRGATFNNLTINFLPPQTKQHTYRLATLFPYATQPLGEFGIQAEVIYNIKKGSKLGGKYGTSITANYSRLNGLVKTPAIDPTDGYTTGFLDLTPQPYFQDINVEISRKFNAHWKGSFTYLYILYDHQLFHQLTGFDASTQVKSHVTILDVSYKVKPKQTLRMEFQHALAKQEFGSWAMVLAEYTIAPHWFIAAYDEYNYGNAVPEKRLHYYSFTGGYNWGQYRLSAGYGRQRAGVLCVGGVCRVVPAANGFNLTVSGSF
ncbi:MAG: hypothetical protein H6581_25965 [Bacteroidia bacterium]|nr:hypothetical protein [Bacteroidia bacterium]